MKIPLTVIGGFLGAGKTTLLNQILSCEEISCRYTVLVNDFGDLAIDSDLIRAHDGDTITFANGCVCCSIGDDFIATVIALMSRPELPQHILIEASGVSDPNTIIEVSSLHPGLQRGMLMVVADAQTIQRRANDERLCDIVETQLAAADLIILNKCDLVGDRQREELQCWLAKRSPSALILPTEQASIPLDAIFAGLNNGDYGGGEDAPESAAFHSKIFSSVTVSFDSPVDIDALKGRLASLPESVLRGKGIVRSNGNDEALFLVQMVGQTIDISAVEEASDLACRSSSLVFVGMEEMPGREWFEHTLNS